MVPTSLAFSVWEACSALQTALILIISDTVPSITTITFLSCESQPTSLRVFTQAAFVVRKGLARCLCHRTFYIPVSLVNLVARIYLSVAFYRLWRSFFTRWHQKQLQIQKWQINHESCQNNNNNNNKTSKQTKKQTSKKQKVKITGTNYISRICLEWNYHAAFMHTRFRNYLLRVHWIVLTLSKWHITNHVFNGCVWKIVRLKSCCVSIHTYIYIYIFCFIYLFFY